MYKRLAITALALATTMAFGQTNKPNTDDYKTNQSGSQKITNGPVIEYTSDHSAMIAWSTKYPGGTYLAYGTDRNNLSQRTQKEWGGTNHRLEIKNLQPSTTYYFQVRTEDAKGSGAMGADVQSNVESFQTVAKGAASDKENRNVGVQGATNVSTNPGASTGASGQYEALYRMGGLHDHLYTTNPSEHSSATTMGYKDEGIAGYLASSQISGTQPLYRLSKPAPAGVGGLIHLYTSDNNERQSALSQGYKEDGPLGYIATSQIAGVTPLYRYRSPTGDYFMSADAADRDRARQQGYQELGTVGYVWSQPQ